MLRLSVDRLLMANEFRQKALALQGGAFERVHVANQTIAMDLHDGAAQRNLSIEGTGCSDHTVFTYHRRFNHLAGR